MILTRAVEQTDTGGAWLSATESSGATPATVTVTVNPSALDVGAYTGSVVISICGCNTCSMTVGVTLTVGQHRGVAGVAVLA